MNQENKRKIKLCIDNCRFLRAQLKSAYERGFLSLDVYGDFYATVVTIESILKEQLWVSSKV